MSVCAVLFCERSKTMNVSDVLMKMIDYSNGNRHDINHFLKVYAYAKVIAEQEQLSEEEQMITEIAAIVHDIACPLCRAKYGNTNGKYQETEGIVLALDFLKDMGLPESISERVAYLVGHHHTYENVDGADYQILLEADYMVNADESGYSQDNIRNTLNSLFKTDTGISILKSVYGIK